MTDELLTILFTDVEGSTALHAAKGDSEARRILGACDEVVRQQVREHGGREIKSTGDGFMIAFGSPRKAVACALAIQEASSRRGDAVRVRAGVHTGEVSEEAGDLFGGAVNAAARICAKAQGGEVLVSDVVRLLCGTTSEVAFTERGLLKLKGFPERWRLYEATPHVRGIAVGERTPFVGRESERAELRTLMQRALAGEGGLIMIGGEPGVGKSRLCQEIAAEARQCFQVFVGHCYESGRDLPYMPWVELVETAMRETAPDALRAALGNEAPELARLVPRLRRVFPDLPPPVEVPPEQQRRYAFNSFRECVIRLSRARPRFYVLEDLHWADEGTLLLLEHLAERLSSIPCLIVGTYRDPPIDVSPQLAETLSSLVRRRQARLLSLRRHSEVEVEALLRALSGQAPPPGVRATIYGETEGNVFFVEEVFRHLVESGRLLDDRGGFRQDIAIAELDVPANVVLVTGRRLDRLSDTTQRALSIAAVAGRHLGFELLEAVADVQGDELIDALDEAERARLIITESGPEEDEYWFGHELIRQTLLTRLPAARRRRHHQRVAEAMERVFSDDLPAQAATIAQHLVEAGPSVDQAKLVHYLVLAGGRALDAAAFEDALRHLRRAASLAEHASKVEQAEMFFQLGMAERGIGHLSEAIVPWRRAIEIYEDLGDADAIGRACAEAGFSLMWAARLTEADEMCRRGLAALGDRVTPDRARLLGISACLPAMSPGGYDQGMANVVQALAWAEELGETAAAGDVLFWKVCVHIAHMEMDEARRACLRGVELLRASGGLWMLAGHLGFLSESLVNLGRFDEAMTVDQESSPLADRLGNAGAVWHSVMVHGAVDFCRTGDLDGLEASAQRAIELCEQAGLGWASWGWSWLALVEFLRGNWDTSIRHAEKAQGLAAPTPFWGLEWALHFEYLAYAGRRDEALAKLEAGRGMLPRCGEPAGWGRWLMLLSAVEGLIVLGETQPATELYPVVRHCMERTRCVNAYPNDCRLLERVAGMAAAAGSNWDAAETHFATALEQAERLPHRLEQAHTRRWYGRMLIERDAHGDHERARTVLEKGVAGYRRMRMPRHEAMVRELLVGVDAGRVHG